MNHVAVTILTLLLGASFVTGCSTSGDNVLTNRVVVNATENVTNPTTQSMGNGVNRTGSNDTAITSNTVGQNTLHSTASFPGSQAISKQSSRISKSAMSNNSSTIPSQHNSTASNTTHSSGHSNSTTGEQPNQSPTSGTKTSTGSTTNGGNPPSPSALPSKLAATWTNKFNSMYVNRNYTGPNSSSLDDLVAEMAQGKIMPDTVKKTILGMQPWDATWTVANNGDGKTYQFVVHDVGAFTYQTSILNDDVTSQQWRAHAQEVLDDSFYTKWDVNWNSSTKTYTVAFLDVGFYLNSTN